jgi:hypothetical protein
MASRQGKADHPTPGYTISEKTGRVVKIKPASRVRLTKGEKKLCKLLSRKPRRKDIPRPN